MLKKALVVFGAVYILLAVVGLGMLWTSPHDAVDGHLLFGIFKHDILHDLIHLISGIAALAAAVASYYYARLYFQVFGVVYALVATAGFVQGTTVLGIIAINTADNYLHLAIAIASLSLGFLTKKVDDRNVDSATTIK